MLHSRYKYKHLSWRKYDEEEKKPDLRLGNVFQLPSRRISRRWTRSGTNLVIFLEALCAQTNLFWREMKIKKMYLKSNTRQENFRTFEKRSLRGRRLKGKGKGVLGARETRRSLFPRAQNPLSLPFQTPATQATRSATY